MLLIIDGTLGPLGLVTVGGNVTPLTTSEAMHIWSLLLKGVDFLMAPREPNTALAKSAKDLLAYDSSYH